MVDPIGSSSLRSGAQGAGTPSPAQFHQAVLDAASGVLGLGAQDVRGALRGGESLADLAQRRGVAKDALVAAVAQGIGSLRGGLPGAPDATEMAQRLVERAGGPGGRNRNLEAAVGPAEPGEPAGPADSWDPLTIVASALRMSVPDLQAAVASGTSIADLIVQHAQTRQTLTGAGLGSTIDVRA